jgi:hypothetical protein
MVAGRRCRGSDLRRRSRFVRRAADPVPPAVRFPAEHGWRVVSLDERPPPAGTTAIKIVVGVFVDRVTWWGLEAPLVVPDLERFVVASSLGDGAALVPLFGPAGERLPESSRVLEILPPSDGRSERSLVDAAFAWLERRSETGPTTPGGVRSRPR